MATDKTSPKILIELAPFMLTLLLCIPLFSTYQSYVISDTNIFLNTAVSTYELSDLSLQSGPDSVTGETVRQHAKYGLGMAFYLLPYIAINDVATKAFPKMDPNIIIGLPNVVLLALLVELLYLSVLALGYSRRRALFIALLATFGTFVYPYINIIFSELLQAVCVTGAFAALMWGKKSDDIRKRTSLFALAGALLGYGVLTKGVILIFLPLFIIYMLASLKKDGKARLRPVIGFFITLSIFGLIVAFLNYSRFGSPFEFGYRDETGLFVNPILSGIRNFILNPNKGLLFFAPITIFLPFALWKFSKKFRSEALLIAALFTANIVFYSAWWAWEGGECWGPRLLLPIVPLGVVPVAALIERRSSIIIITLVFLLGFFTNMLGVVQDFTGFNYPVIRTTYKMKLDIPRPTRDYETGGTYIQPPPYVVSSTHPEFNAISGHLWLIKAVREGKVKGYGLGPENKTIQNPPWKKAFPELPPLEPWAYPEEVRIRMECPSPLFMAAFVCPGRRPSAPYYYNALITQSIKARAFGKEADAKRLLAKAKRYQDEHFLRIKQFGR